ncbi:MAG TPA: MlaD family protein [Rhizomicrobium sp.]|nr:MlaD family protein [Rhizomicrobium sp.]
MQNNTVETLISAAVIAVALGFFLFAYNSTHGGNYNTYEVRAALGSVDGITTGADVRLHGIKIGTVSAIELDPKTYKPIVHLALRDDIPIAQDSSMRIASGILNGNPYFSIQPGHSGKTLAAGGLWKPR